LKMKKIPNNVLLDNKVNHLYDVGREKRGILKKKWQKGKRKFLA